MDCGAACGCHAGGAVGTWDTGGCDILSGNGGGAVRGAGEVGATDGEEGVFDLVITEGAAAS